MDRVSRSRPCVNGDPCSILLYEDEIRSVEGTGADRDGPEGTAPLSTSRRLDKRHDNSLCHDLL